MSSSNKKQKTKVKRWRKLTSFRSLFSPMGPSARRCYTYTLEQKKEQHRHHQLQFGLGFYHVGANGRTAPRRFVFHFGLIYSAQATLALFSTPRHSTTPHPTNVPHKTWYQRSSNGDLQSLQAPLSL